MAAETCAGVRFEGELTVEVREAISPDWPPTFFADSQVVGLTRFGTTGCYREPRLWLGAPTIWFRGRIIATGDERVREWRAGFLQTISEAHWTGYYSDGKVLQYRLNTTHGHLKDGMDYSLFMKNEWPFRQTEAEGVHRVDVHAEDGPAHMYFREYSGDPGRPGEQPAGAALGRLQRTEGRYRFRTYLAVVNHYRKSVVTLAESHWTIVWDGSYDFATRTWVPVDVDRVLRHQEDDRPAKYENLTPDSTPPPFSLFMEKAKKSWEVLVDGAWVPCKDCYPTWDEADKPTLATWLS
jgi:hypothetical protein